jgi:OmpA-OmpF porin, OOP family
LSTFRRRSSASLGNATSLAPNPRQPDDIYYALWAAPVERIERRYTLDEIRYSTSLRERMPRIDVGTVTFDSGSWEVTPGQVERLALIADGINRAIGPSERSFPD